MNAALAYALARLAVAPVIAILILWGDEAFFASASPVSPWAFGAAFVLFLAAATADMVRQLKNPAGLTGLDRAASLALLICILLALAKTSLPFDVSGAAILIAAREALVLGLRERQALLGQAETPIQGEKLRSGAIWLGCGCALAAQTLIYFAAPAEIVVWLLRIARGGLWAGAAVALITGALYARQTLTRER